MGRKTALILILSLAIFAIGCGNIQAEKSQYGKAPDFQLQDIDGNMIRLSEYSGKVIILNFFATWCPPCRMEMPDFNEIAKEYKDDVKIIAINVGKEGLPKVQSFTERNRLIFTIAMDNGKVSGLYGPIRAIPVSVIIDKNFNIAKKYVGMRTKEVFVRDIQELLK